MAQDKWPFSFKTKKRKKNRGREGGKGGGDRRRKAVAIGDTAGCLSQNSSKFYLQLLLESSWRVEQNTT